VREQLNLFADFLGDFPKPAYRDDPPEKLPGRELADLVAGGLRNHGFHVGSVDTYEIEHLIQCSSGQRTFHIHIWVDDISRIERWEVCCPPSYGWIARWLGQWVARLFGPMDYDEHKTLLEAIDGILKSSGRVRDLRWFRYYEAPWLRDKYPKFAGPVGMSPLTAPAH
jgi:hypothetical protein